MRRSLLVVVVAALGPATLAAQASRPTPAEPTVQQHDPALVAARAVTKQLRLTLERTVRRLQRARKHDRELYERLSIQEFGVAFSNGGHRCCVVSDPVTTPRSLAQVVSFDSKRKCGRMRLLTGGGALRIRHRLAVYHARSGYLGEARITRLGEHGVTVEFELFIRREDVRLPRAGDLATTVIVKETPSKWNRPAESSLRRQSRINREIAAEVRRLEAHIREFRKSARATQAKLKGG